MKRILPMLFGVLGMAMVATSPAHAIDGLTANGAVTSNYIFRGLSQSAANPAVQGGVDYDAGNGFAVGAWASSLDFGTSPSGDDNAPIEIDLYGSYTLAITDMFSVSGGVVTYNYPNVPAGVNFNWYEVWGGLSYDFGFFSASGKLYYSPDYVNLSDRQLYYTGGVSVPITPWLALNANVGRTDLGHSIFPVIKDYTDWNVSLAATVDQFTLTVGYTDTDLDGAYEITSGPFQTNEQFFVMLSFRI